MIGTDAMSGEDTDDKDVQGSAIEQKELVCIPVHWLNPGIVEMLHTVDTWKQPVTSVGLDLSRENMGKISQDP